MFQPGIVTWRARLPQGAFANGSSPCSQITFYNLLSQVTLVLQQMPA